ncbi:MAG: DUF1826 domain-containing protein [Neptuniibacter sp.]
MSVAEKLDIHESYRGTLEQMNFAEGVVPEVLTRIYEESINIVVLQRDLTQQINLYCQQLVEKSPHFQLRSAIKHADSSKSLDSLLPEVEGKTEFVNDINLLLDMYSCLFDLEEVGVRLQVLDRAMCPRFHTDKLGCRLVSTYQGPATEWLPNDCLDRTKLGAGNMGLSDAESGLYPSAESVQQVSAGDVVLLKGEGWFGNEGHGAVHRSPTITNLQKRIVVTMDFA